MPRWINASTGKYVGDGGPLPINIRASWEAREAATKRAYDLAWEIEEARRLEAAQRRQEEYKAEVKRWLEVFREEQKREEEERRQLHGISQIVEREEGRKKAAAWNRRFHHSLPLTPIGIGSSFEQPVDVPDWVLENLQDDLTARRWEPDEDEMLLYAKIIHP